jgi:hypothetical protein
MKSGAFPLLMRTRVAAMEDVLDLYAQPYDPTAPQVCFDEKPLVVHGEVREPLPMKPGQPQRLTLNMNAWEPRICLCVSNRRQDAAVSR